MWINFNEEETTLTTDKTTLAIRAQIASTTFDLRPSGVDLANTDEREWGSEGL